LRATRRREVDFRVTVFAFALAFGFALTLPLRLDFARAGVLPERRADFPALAGFAAAGRTTASRTSPAAPLSAVTALARSSTMR
jgi:hypothetical protein